MQRSRGAANVFIVLMSEDTHTDRDLIYVFETYKSTLDESLNVL